MRWSIVVRDEQCEKKVEKEKEKRSSVLVAGGARNAFSTAGKAFRCQGRRKLTGGALLGQ